MPANDIYRTVNEEWPTDRVSKSLSDIVGSSLLDNTGRSRDAGAPCFSSPGFDQSANCLRAWASRTACCSASAFAAFISFKSIVTLSIVPVNLLLPSL